MQFKKPFLTVNEQISLLKDRGLIIEDEIQTKHYLNNINYYHLAIYAKYFQEKKDVFIKGTTFNNIIKIYEFDKKIRLGILDILERIEMSFKITMTYEIGIIEKNSFWYTEKSNYQLSTDDQFKIFKKILEDIHSSKEPYIQDFYKKYTDKYPPSWMFFEACSFGQVAKLAHLLIPAHKQKIAAKYRLPKAATIQWLKSLSFLRNICAHHSMLFYRTFSKEVRIHQHYQHLFYNQENNTLYSYMVILCIFLKKINPTSQYIHRLESLIKEYSIPVEKMGFPANWKEQLTSIS